MTEQEAVEVMKAEKTCVGRNIKHECNRDCFHCDLLKPDDDILAGYDMAISALEEIQQYRALGTVEELKESTFSGLELANIWAAIEKLRKYEAIGTVEELQEAMEKQRAKTPYIWGDGYSGGEPVFDMYECPYCGQDYEIDGEKYDFCPNCGQAIDWRNEG